MTRWQHVIPQLLVACLLSASAAAAAEPFQESGGQVVMEAERYDAKLSRSGKDWVLQTGQSGYSGTGFLTALPNAGVTQNTGYTTQSPELVYRVRFSTTGTYYVWVRGAGPTTTDDSLHVGIDGIGPASADRLAGFPTSWTWSRTTMDQNAPATLQVTTPGEHTIHAWMREDGFRLDKLLLRTNSASTAPTGVGPAESARVAPADTSPPTVSLAQPQDGSTVTGTVTVKALATDNVGVTGVRFYLDGTALGAEDTSSPYELSWDTTLTANGSHTLTAVARDAAGNTATANPVTITALNVPPDTTPPTGTVTINGGAAAINALDVTLALQAEDDAGPVAQMRCSNDGVTYAPAEPFATTKPWSLLSGDGTKTVSVRFADAAGNWSTPSTAAIILDTTPPRIDILSPADGEVLTAPPPSP